MTRYFVNYYKAKDEAEKLKLKECEYGDYNNTISYCVWNETGDREDEAKIECYYYFENGRPEKKANAELADWVRKELGVEVEKGD